MAKKTYKWLARLIDKITNKDCPNNNYFWYYGHEVILQSGTRDYVSVTIAEDDRGWRKNQISFSFDYWTKELVFDSYNNYEERDTIIRAFKSIYNDGWNDVYVGHDAPFEEELKFYEPMINNNEYDQEKIMAEYNELLKRKAA